LLVLDDLGRWAPQWDQLVDGSPLPSPFLRSWWLTGTGLAQRRFVLVVADDRLLGGLALEERRQLGLPCLTMLSAGPLCPDHLDLLADEEHADAVVSGVAAWLRRPGMRLIDLEGIHPDSRLIKALPGRVRREPLAGAPWAPLGADASAYIAARPPGFRRTLQRASSRLAADGVTHRINRGTSAVLALGVLRQLHTAQWGNRSRFLPSFDRFAAGCRLGTEFDEVAVHELTIGETVIAIIVTFEVAGRLSLYQSARLTERRWRNAPSVLLAAIITDACERGFAEVDFLRGDESYKSNFAPERRELLRLRSAHGAVGRVALLAETAERKVRVLAARLVRFARRRRAGSRPPSGGSSGGPDR
jgi:CelD/BcsL family acetyltransferase involved in cellulose biosynthesis